MDKKQYNMLADKYMKRMCEALAAHVEFIPDLAEEIGAALCDAILETSHIKQYPFEVAQFDLMISTVFSDRKDYYWKAIAGFTTKKDATTYKNLLESLNPEKKYSILIDGVPEDNMNDFLKG